MDPAELSVAERLHQLGEQFFKEQATFHQRDIRSDNSLAVMLSKAEQKTQTPIAIIVDGKRYGISHDRETGVSIQYGDETCFLGAEPKEFLISFRQFVGDKKFSVLYREDKT